MSSQTIQTNKKTSVLVNRIQEDIAPEGTILVRVNFKYPVLESTQDKAIDSINAFVAKLIQSYLKFAATTLLKEASEEIKKTPDSFLPFSAVMNFTLGTCENGIFSFFFDIFIFRANSKYTVKRLPLSFDLTNGHIINPSDYVKPLSKKTLMKRLEDSCENIAESRGMYSDYKRLLRRYFSKNKCYFKKDGLMYCYDSGTLAPHEKGAICIKL